MDGTPANAAWTHYHQKINELRLKIFSHPYAQRKENLPGAFYLLQQMQAVAFNRVTAPRPHFARFYLTGMFEPMTYTLGGASSDMMHRQVFLDGQRTYRIVGRRGTASLRMMQLMNGYWGDPREHLTVTSYAFDQFDFVADGSYELTASAQAGSRNHIVLDPGSRDNCLMFRELIADWENETLSTAHVEMIGEGPTQSVMPALEEVTDRLYRAISFMEEYFREYGPGMIEDTMARVGPNQFLRSDIMQRTGNVGGSVGTAYFFVAFELGDHDALVIEMHDPKARYWSYQLTDCWHQSCEPAWHQSSLNMRQAVPDGDGSYRLVVSLRDPGVANWLDPAGHRLGLLELRIVESAVDVQPTARVTTIANLESLLPPSTARVDANQRRTLLRRRRLALLARWGC
jgi:Protein of unknown function (DUF1254)